MTNLYSISTELKATVEHLISLDMDDETITDTIESMGIGEALEKKLEACAMVRENYLSEAKAKKELADNLMAKVKSLNTNADRLFNSIDVAMRMNNIEKVALPYFDIKFKKLPVKVIVTDENEVDPMLLDYVPESYRVNKSEALAALKALPEGETIKGLELSEPETKLVIK